MYEFCRLQTSQRWKNVFLYTKQAVAVFLLISLLNQSLTINAASILTKREIISTRDDNFGNVINATTEQPNFYHKKNVIDITNIVNSNNINKGASNTTTLSLVVEVPREQHDNKIQKIPKEFRSHEIGDDQQSQRTIVTKIVDENFPVELDGDDGSSVGSTAPEDLKAELNTKESSHSTNANNV